MKSVFVCRKFEGVVKTVYVYHTVMPHFGCRHEQGTWLCVD